MSVCSKSKFQHVVTARAHILRVKFEASIPKFISSIVILESRLP